MLPKPNKEDETLTELKQSFSPISSLKAITIHELLLHECKTKEFILEPIIAFQSLCMIYAFRGIGKTFMALYIAFVIASGSTLFNWKAPKPRGVLYIDGEMPLYALKERIAAIIAASNCELTAPLIFLTPDMQEFGMPDLATKEGQEAIEVHITSDIDLIVIDNLSCLVRTGRENEGESWLPVQEWALRLRAKGKSVLFIHHSGKSGHQRGTSRKEDVLDTVITLKRPNGYTPEQGAFFEVHFEKNRYLYGDAVNPFEAQLVTNEQGLQCWVTQSLEQTTFEKVIALHKDEYSQKEISIELGINKSVVSRHVSNAKGQGRL